MCRLHLSNCKHHIYRLQIIVQFITCTNHMSVDDNAMFAPSKALIAALFHGALLLLLPHL